MKPIVSTALMTGMRKQEILGLKWSQVHIEKALVPEISLIGKGGKVRHIPLSPDMINLLLDLEEGKGQSEFVFLLRGKPMNDIKKGFALAMDRAGIFNFRFHDLRHTFASHFVMRGGDLLTLKEILGHSNLSMVQIYAHLADKHKLEQMQQMTGLFVKKESRVLAMEKKVKD